MPQTGPKTENGKRKSALNALKHGCYARSEEALATLHEVCPVKLDDVLKEMEVLYKPINSLERVLVKRIALCLWRLARVETMEKKAFIRNPYEDHPTSSLDKIVKYERMVDIQLHKAISALERQRMLTNSHPKEKQDESPAT